MVQIGGRPLIDYGVIAAQAWGRFERIFCSTDDSAIADHARALGIEAVERPRHLATDQAKIDDVGAAFLREFPAGELPDAVVLIQPTSPFLLPEHIDDLVDTLARDPEAQSAHNFVPVSHRYHAWNQRFVGNDRRVRFLFAEERRRARNKQEKPVLNIFGNLIMVRAEALVRGEGFYAEPIVAAPISHPYDFDLDGPGDVVLAAALLARNAVALPHLRSSGMTTK